MEFRRLIVDEVRIDEDSVHVEYPQKVPDGENGAQGSVRTELQLEGVSMILICQ